MTLRNDKERKAFVDDIKNWELVKDIDGNAQMIMGRVRVLRFAYKGHEDYYKLQIWQEYEHFDLKLKKHVWKTDWRTLGIYRISDTTDAFTYGFSAARLVDRIKEIDKEEKGK